MIHIVTYILTWKYSHRPICIYFYAHTYTIAQVPPFPNDEERAVAFNYIVNHDLGQYVKIKIRGMITDDCSYTSSFAKYIAYNKNAKVVDEINMIHDRMYVSIQYCSDSLPISNKEDVITDLVSPKYFKKDNESVSADSNNKIVTWEWEKWITLPIKYSELTPTSTVALTLYNLDGVPYGGTYANTHSTYTVM